MIGVVNGELLSHAYDVDAKTVTRRVIIAPEVILITIALLGCESDTFAVAHTDRLQVKRLT